MKVWNLLHNFGEYLGQVWLMRRERGWIGLNVFMRSGSDSDVHCSTPMLQQIDEKNIVVGSKC